MLFFVVLTLPRAGLERRAAQQLAQVTGAEVSVGAWSPRLDWRGPRMRLERLEFRWPGAVPLRLDTVDVRPAWSAAWLGGSAWKVEIDSELGRWSGTSETGEAIRHRGELRDFDLTYGMLLTTIWQMQGLLDADVELTQSGARLDGPVEIRGRDGMIRIPTLVAPIPFEELEGRLRFGGDHYVRIESLSLEGPVASVELHGHIGYAPSPELAPLRLEGRIRADEPGVRSAMGVQGITFAADAVARFRVSGTVSQPVLQ